MAAPAPANVSAAATSVTRERGETIPIKWEQKANRCSPLSTKPLCCSHPRHRLYQLTAAFFLLTKRFLEGTLENSPKLRIITDGRGK